MAVQKGSKKKVTKKKVAKKAVKPTIKQYASREEARAAYRRSNT
ncbi:unnamed protein product [marine sediment metagenome]|uniref:Uncharacterized protein n=1 Tax=marine sediment metagenome TaxID=412755 RepID=X0Y3B1_9ZZZZ